MGPPESVEKGYPPNPGYPLSNVMQPPPGYGVMPPPVGPMMQNPMLQNPMVQNPMMQNPMLPNPMMQNPMMQQTMIRPPIMQQPIGFYEETGPGPMIQPGISGDPSMFLHYLTTISTLEVRQKIEVLEILSGFETENKYTIYNENNQPILFASEQSDCCERQCCGPQRSFDMSIVDCYSTEVIKLSRPLACQACCFPCCLMKMTVESPPGNYAGEIEQLWSICAPRYAIKNAFGETVLYIEGPFCVIKCCNDVEFKVLSASDESQIGEIRKKWSGFAQEAFTDADNFSVTFPPDLEVSIKVLLVGAVFLVDMMYFEEPAGNRRR